MICILGQLLVVVYDSVQSLYLLFPGYFRDKLNRDGVLLVDFFFETVHFALDVYLAVNFGHSLFKFLLQFHGPFFYFAFDVVEFPLEGNDLLSLSQVVLLQSFQVPFFLFLLQKQVVLLLQL